MLKWFYESSAWTRYAAEVEPKRRGDPTSYMGTTILSLERRGLLRRENRGRQTEKWVMTKDGRELYEAICKGN